MFGFIYKDITNNFGLVYDGNKANLRFCIDKEEAQRWHESTNNIKSLKKLIGGQYCNVSFNIMQEGEIVTSKFNDFLISNKSISPRLIRAWSILLKEFDVVDNEGMIGFKHKGGSEGSEDLVDPGLMLMKDFIFGLFRLDPITLVTKREKGKLETVPLQFEQHFDGKHYLEGTNELLGKIPYNYMSIKGETPLYGIYSPQMRNLMFGGIMDFGGGRILQKRQIKTLFEMGEETYLAASRGSGKSFIAAYLASIYAMRSVVSRREKIEGSIIYYYGISQKSNQSVINKILSMNRVFRQGELFKYSKDDNCLYFMDGGDTAGYIQFLSDKADEPGRGGRPTMVIVDEASRISDDVIANIRSGYSGMPKLYISTITHETKKNRFYEGLVKAELHQNTYPVTTEEVILNLWRKYGLDKIQSLEELKTQERHDKLTEMRGDFFEARPYVGLRFTLDDVEYKSAREKEKLIADATSISMNYLLAEHYSEFLDNGKLLDPERGRIQDSEIPEIEFMDCIVLSLDHAETFDNPVLLPVGSKGLDIYVLESIILSKDEKERIRQVQDTIVYYKKRNKRIYLVGDCTQAPSAIRSFYEDRGILFDMPVQTTKGKDINYKDGFALVGKKFLVNIGKSMFDKGNIKIADKFNGEKGLLEEIGNFQEIKMKNSDNITYKASKGKDDQVMALLYAILYLYENGLKDEHAVSDNTQQVKETLSPEDFYDYMKAKKIENKKVLKIEKAEAELFSYFGF